MLKIRLARIGKKKQPTYRIIVSDSRKDTYGVSLELLGRYNPFTKVCDVQKDRINYWISKGAKVSPTTHNLLVDQNVIAGPKVKAYKPKKKEKTEAPAAEAAAPAPVEAKPSEAPVETKAEAKTPEQPEAK